VEFDWQGIHYVRDEIYYLMSTTCSTKSHEPEGQFKREWLGWESALVQLTFEAEREWLRRAQRAWASRLQNIADQEAKETHQHTEVEEEIPVGDEEP